MTQASTIEMKRRDPTLLRRSKKYFWGIAFLLPAIIVFGIFLWTPICKGVLYSFMKVDFVNGNTYVGLSNYREIFDSSLLWTSVKNTLAYIGLCLLIGYWIPSLVAIALSELRRMQGVMRLVVYLPHIVPAVVLYGMWQWLYDPLGPANQLVSLFGADPIMWLTDKGNAMFSIVIAETWQGFGGATLIYLAGIVSIPKDLYEAAEIDGAGVLQRIRHITIPNIRHLYLLLLIFQLIATSQGYMTHMALTGGGPNNATLTYMYQIINEAFTNFNYGKASAMGVLMFLVLGTLSVTLYSLQGRGKQE